MEEKPAKGKKCTRNVRADVYQTISFSPLLPLSFFLSCLLVFLFFFFCTLPSTRVTLSFSFSLSLSFFLFLSDFFACHVLPLFLFFVFFLLLLLVVDHQQCGEGVALRPHPGRHKGFGIPHGQGGVLEKRVVHLVDQRPARPQQR